ncbi:MAG: S8 family serine peptidase [Planctomycetaceae bacterium]|nr:S8 family serine peptidase [Planctomycetaceae bacterium]
MPRSPRTARRSASASSGAILFTLLGAVPAALAQEAPGPEYAAEHEAVPARTEARWLVHIEHDAAALSADLAELRLARRSGDRGAFEAAAERVWTRGRVAAEALRGSIEARGLRVLDALPFGDAVVVEGRDATARLAGLAGVRGVQRDSFRSSQSLNTDLAIGPSNHDHQGAWSFLSPDGLQGAGVEVAVLDSGIDLTSSPGGFPHPAFYPNGVPSGVGPGINGSRILSASAAAVGFGLPNPIPQDEHGHGTRVASIVGGAAWGPSGASDGGAPAVGLRSIRITDALNPGLASVITMSQAVQNAILEPGVRVINLSFEGSSSPNFWPNPAIDQAAEAGVLAVLAAGVSGPKSPFQHGAFNALTVGASFAASQQPYFLPGYSGTAMGPRVDGRRYPDLLAVGEALTAAQLGNPSVVAQTWGTSGAAALVSGAAAVLFDARPGLDALEARAILLAASNPVTQGPEDARSDGFLRVPEALDLALSGRFVRAFAPPFVRARYQLAVVEGEPYSLALVWNRRDFLNNMAGDLDLVVRNQSGLVLAESRSLLDSSEVVRGVAPETGVLWVEVETMWHPDNPALLPMEYALAGVSGTPVVDALPCAFGASTLGALHPAQVTPSIGSPDWIKVTGCNLSSTSAVRVGGIGAELLAVAPTMVAFLLPNGVVPGSNTVELVTDSGVLATPLAVGPGAPYVTAAPNFGLYAFAGPYIANLLGAAGNFGALFLSPQLGPTAIPGVPALAIGGGFSGLVLLRVGTLPIQVGIDPPFGLPVGLNVHTQGVMADLTQPGFPLSVSNVAKSVHVGN